MSSYTGFLFKSGGFSSATAGLLRQAQDPDFGSQHWMKEKGIKKKKDQKGGASACGAGGEGDLAQKAQA